MVATPAEWPGAIDPGPVLDQITPAGGGVSSDRFVTALTAAAAWTGERSYHVPGAPAGSVAAYRFSAVRGEWRGGIPAPTARPAGRFAAHEPS